MTLNDFAKVEFKSRFQVTLWEHKNYNHHRAVAEVKGTGQTFDDTEFVALREEIRQQLKISKFKGFGVGLVLRDFEMQEEKLREWVDNSTKKGEACQWVIASFESKKRMAGCHMWQKGLTTSIYEKFLQAGADAGFEVSNLVKGPEGLMKFVTMFSLGFALSRYHGTNNCEK